MKYINPNRVSVSDGPFFVTGVDREEQPVKRELKARGYRWKGEDFHTLAAVRKVIEDELDNWLVKHDADLVYRTIGGNPIGACKEVRVDVTIKQHHVKPCRECGRVFFHEEHCSLFERGVAP